MLERELVGERSKHTYAHIRTNFIGESETVRWQQGEDTILCSYVWQAIGGRLLPPLAGLFNVNAWWNAIKSSH